MNPSIGANHRAQAQSRLRTQQQQQLLNSSMQGMMPDYQMLRLHQNGMQMNGDLRAKAMQNRGNAFNPYVISWSHVPSGAILGAPSSIVSSALTSTLGHS